jgi:RimJ/RimL family protein N-acetyltransferase
MKDSHVIGYIGLYPLEHGSNGATDSPQLQFRFFLDTPEQSKGYARAACEDVLDAYMDALDAYMGAVGGGSDGNEDVGGGVRDSSDDHSVFIQARPDNAASIALATRIGFTEVSGEFTVAGVALRRFELPMAKWRRRRCAVNY